MTRELYLDEIEHLSLIPSIAEKLLNKTQTWKLWEQLRIEVTLKRAERDLLVAKLAKIEPELKELEMQDNELHDELYQKSKEHYRIYHDSLKEGVQND